MSVITKAGAVFRKSTYTSAFFTLREYIRFRPMNNITTDQPGLANFQDAMFGAPNGIPDGALQLSTVWACINLIAQTIATLPLFLYLQDGDTRKLATRHPLYSILHDSPNADMTAVEFWEAILAQILLRGNSYVLKSYNVLGQIVALTPLDPDKMREPYRNANGVIQYDYSAPTGIKHYTDAEVWHIKGFSTDGLIGISPIRAGLLSMGAARSADRAAATMFGSNMRPTAVLTRPEFFTKDQREQMKEKLREGFFGDPTTGRMMLLEGATEYKQLSISPEDAQLLETRTFQVEDLCRWFNVNPALIGHPGTASNFGTGREQIMLNFLAFTLRPYLKRIEQGIAKALLAPAERSRYFAEFSVEGLLRADTVTRFQVYANAVQNGLKTRNECRILENDAPMDGGDELTVQSNLIPIKLLGKITNTAQTAKNAFLDWLGIEQKDKADAPQE